MINNKFLFYNPLICAVEDTYQVILVTKVNCTVKIKVGLNTYYSNKAGVMISDKGIHKIVIPQKDLDSICQYEIVLTEMENRKPYYSILGKTFIFKYIFYPLKKQTDINIFQIADCHGNLEEAIDSFKIYNKRIDLLILNGDNCSDLSSFQSLFFNLYIGSEITHGNLPCVISRGNHELRGIFAQNYIDYIPTKYGNTYYTFKVGCIWGIVLDTFEDKEDSNKEYNDTVCCKDLRIDETQFIKNVVNYNDYENENFKYKLVICHTPFTYQLEPPFNIEREIYMEWCQILKKKIKPHLMLCGHIHQIIISECGGSYDTFGQPCPVIIGSELKKLSKGIIFYTGIGLTLTNRKAIITYNSDNGIKERYIIMKQISEDNNEK